MVISVSSGGVTVSSGVVADVSALLSIHLEIISTNEMTTCLLTAADFAPFCEENKKMTAILLTIKTASKIRQKSTRLFFFFILCLSFLLLLLSPLSYHSFSQKASIFARLPKKILIRTKAAKKATKEYQTPLVCVRATGSIPRAKADPDPPLPLHQADGKEPKN